MSPFPSTEELLTKIQSAVLQRRDQMVDDTSRILQFQTVSGGSEEEQRLFESEVPACLDWFEGRVNALGFESLLCPLCPPCEGIPGCESES